MDLIITSAWRPTDQRTIKTIPRHWLDVTTLLVPMDQYNEYKKNNKGIKIITHGRYGMSKTRQWVLDNCDKFDKNICLLDDDLDFSVRRDGKLIRCQSRDVDDMFTMLSVWINDGLAHAGISDRLGNNRITEDFTEITRHMRVLCLNTEIVNKINAKFNRVPCMSDFDMALQLLEHGYKNRVSYTYANGHRGSNTKGGCSTYRTPELLAKAANELARLHPGVVLVKTKKTKKAWGGFDSNERVDVTIQWKKAYRRKINKRSIREFF